MWERLKYDLIELRDKFIPLRSIQSKNKCKWVTKKVTKRRRAKKKAWIKYTESGKDPKYLAKYKTKLKASIKENDNAKINFEERLAQNIKNDNKSFYAYARSKQRTKVRVGPLKDNLGNLVTDAALQADMLNDYFSSVFTKENLNRVPQATEVFKGTQEESLESIFINEDLVKKKLDKLDTNKSQGPDEIHPKLLYELRQELSSTLTKIFNLSIQTGIVPQDWRDANVTPLHKKGSKAKPENYRPVSLTSVIGKMMESSVKEALVIHLERYKLIKPSQHGFTKGRSCLTNLLVFFEEVTKEIDEGNDVDLIYLDFAKAFDKVPYQRLFKKVEAHGIRGTVLKWIKHWLEDRRQKVCIDGMMSKWNLVTSGVPQGSVLGPILFLIYINDLDNNLASKIKKFADDTKLCKSISSIEDVESLKQDLDILTKWSEDWQIEFNTDKCKIMQLGRENFNKQYTLCNSTLKMSDKETDLGIIVSDNLKFSAQTNESVRKANFALGQIKRTIKHKTKDVIVRLYKALVRPKLEYCVQAWSPYLKKDKDKLEKVQHRATKMIYELKNKSYEDRLAETRLTTLEERRIRGDLIETFKMIKGLSNVDYRDFFTIVSKNKTRGHSLKLEKPRARLDLRKYSFSHRVVNEWNKLPEHVVKAESVNTFKNRYDNYISSCTSNHVKSDHDI